MSSLYSNGLQKSSDDVNPFKIPEHNNLFQMRNKEKSQRKLKMKFAARIRAGQTRLKKELKEESNIPVTHNHAQLQITPARRVSMKDPNVDKGGMNEYITKKRELFLLECSLAVKKGKIQLLEQMATEEEVKLTRAIKIAEQETKVKLEEVAEIKKIISKMVAIKRYEQIYEDILKEYKKYKEFLLMLSPPEWQEKQRSKSRHSTVSPNTEKTGRKNQKEQRKKDSGERRVARGFLSSQEARASSRQSVSAPGTDSSDCECNTFIFNSREKERAAELEMKAKLFSFEQHKPEDQVRYLSFVVLLCQVLSTESSVSSMFFNFFLLFRLHDEKIYLQMKQQDERQKKALERSQSVKKLMPHSQPPVRKHQTNKNTEATKWENEEFLYFFC
uniref:DUF4200 domain-containing protein n=1 Tax=Cyprinus carpio carpio TaxID=630221 RepID=A0A8C1D166_CYPCA